MLDILLQCPEITCPEGEKNVKDYGGQDLGNIFNQTGIPVADYFNACGILVGGNSGVTGDMIIELMSNISRRLSSGEVLGLIGGNITDAMLTVAEEELGKYPQIKVQLNNRARIEDFFTCAGLGIPKNILSDIENDITDTYNNPELCTNLLLDAKNKLAERCGVSDLFDAAAKRATNFDLDKYKALADTIRKHQNMSQQLPSLFGDCFGNQGVLSGLPNPTMDHVIDMTVEQIMSPIKSTMADELRKLTKNTITRQSNSTVTEFAVMVKRNRDTDDMIDSMYPVSLIKLLLDDKDNIYRDTLYPYNKKPSDDEAPIPINYSLQDIENNIVVSAPTQDKNGHVRIDLGTDTELKIEFLPAKVSENGEALYEDNYYTTLKVKNSFGVGNSTQTIDLSSPTKKLPDILVEHLQEFPLDPDSTLTPQSQYFSELLLSNLEGSGYSLNDKDREELKDIFGNDVFWATWKSVLDTMANAVANSELLDEYQLNRKQEFLNGFNPLWILPQVYVMFPILGVAPSNAIVESFYNGTYFRKEMTRLDMTPKGTQEEGGLIDIDRVKKIIKKGYDFSIFHDPNSDKLGMPHYAILGGLLVSFVQVFVGEIYIRGLIPLSKFPTSIVTQQESTVELVYRTISEFLEQGPSEFKSQLSFIITELFKGCNRQSLDFDFTPDEQNNPEAGFPGTVKGQVEGFEKDYRILNWQDGLRFIIRQELLSPIPFINNKLSSFTKKGGEGIGKINPISSISYPFMMQVHDEPFRKEGLDNVSLFQPSRIDQFKDGRFFFQYYYEVIDWSEGDDNYVESVVNRDLRLKGIISEENFVELISSLVGIPPLYPENTTPTDPLLGSGTDGSLNAGNASIPLNDLFKEINFGIRYCFGAIQTNATDEAGDPLIKEQSPAIVTMIESIKKMADITDTTLILGDKLMTGPHQDSKVNEFLDYVKETKSLLLIEDVNSAWKSTFASMGAGHTKPYYTVILPLFDQKRKINGPDGFGGGWSFLDQRADSANYVSDQISLFLKESYGSSLMKELFKEMPLNPAYEGLLNYCFPVPKMANMLITYGILIASKEPAFAGAFNQTKVVIRALINKTYAMRGRDQYKNKFTDPY